MKINLFSRTEYNKVIYETLGKILPVFNIREAYQFCFLQNKDIEVKIFIPSILFRDWDDKGAILHLFLICKRRKANWYPYRISGRKFCFLKHAQNCSLSF